MIPSAGTRKKHFIFGGQVAGGITLSVACSQKPDIWLVSFMNYDLGYVDREEKTLQLLENPFGPKV
jgi:hypothetical protein